MSELLVEEWPAVYARLVDQMCTMRPGLTKPQAHAALEALRTLRWVLHPETVACVGPPPLLPVCGETTVSPSGGPLACALAPHDEAWHEDGRGTRWKTVDRPEGAAP